ncbi:Outer membrane protein transport protein (OMPP1/FadL/TodX) [Robiginitalea myxolifaciens]|uniref:Outer membrane protein transport protein (OMPP1/FadL/TodX) n=1 Tax=Robiginitalea myxolifaciens TaxID=400055 RepID=A0A1I6HEA9_9FLAO|nr:outer membrane protein transport protein [Robiginitalea myxolifaciens]SFR52789.1 Outer membrane protein transport protein (OMPP1/FadL/TodX) [Robiginitalea myxolifaciens]
MKRIFTFILTGLCLSASAQTINDVLRYSLEDVQGTARFQSMSGAFGALGGDLSAIAINPAGTAVFENGIMSVSASNYHRDNLSGFASDLTQVTDNSLDVNQAGGVFVFKSGSNSDWSKIAVGINYELVRNFDNRVRAVGSTAIGLDNYFLNFAQGVPLGPLRVQDGETIADAYLDIGGGLGFADQQAFLGFQAGFIDPVDPDDDNNTQYLSNSEYSTVIQDYEEQTSGFNSKFSVTFAGAYKNNLYLGASLNVHSTLFERITFLDESGYQAASPIQSALFDSFLRSEGSGFSFNLGAIARLNDNVRIGGSYQSPTWYRILDDFAQRANTDFEFKNQSITQINFGVVNLFEAYTIRTPAKYTGSLALVFGPQGLLSFDYDYQDFSTAQLRPVNDPNFSAENDFISEQLGAVSTFRLGGEYRIENWSLRGGYRYQQSPYKDNDLWGDLEGYSAGLGYSWGPNRIDLAYSRTDQDTAVSLYDGGLSDIGVNRINTLVTLSYTINF